MDFRLLPVNPSPSSSFFFCFCFYKERKSLLDHFLACVDAGSGLRLRRSAVPPPPPPHFQSIFPWISDVWCEPPPVDLIPCFFFLFFSLCISGNADDAVFYLIQILVPQWSGSLECSAVQQPVSLAPSLGRRHGQGEEEEEELVRAHQAALHLLIRPQADAQTSRQGSITPPVRDLVSLCHLFSPLIFSVCPSLSMAKRRMNRFLLFAQKAKSKRWLPGKLRAQQSFALPAPAPATAGAPADQIRQAEDEQSKHAVAVALATAAAAEAAVAAAHAAAHVVRLTGQPPGVAHVPRQVQVQEQEHERAAVAIQSAYRGYLVRRRSSKNADFFCSCFNK